MKKLLMMSAAALVIASPAAFAEHDGGPHGKGPGGLVEKLDTDKDGAISKAEFLKFHEERFAEIDTNKDGKITKEEGEAKKAEWKAKMKEMRAEKPATDKPADAPVEKPADAPVEKPAETPAP